MRIKNWTNRQAFRKDRPPSWIRLYFDLLDNFEWHSLPPEHAKVLIELWLLAAQHDPQGGRLPSIEKVAFLLRRDLTDTKRIVKELCGEWVTEDDTDGLQHGYQMVTERLPNGSTEIEIEIEKRRDREEGVDLPTANAAPHPVIQAWNDMALESGLSKAQSTKKRAQALRVRMNEAPFREGWQEAIAKIPSSPFLTGQNDRGWRADMDWFLKPDSVVRILEGKYDGHGKQHEIAEAIKKAQDDCDGITF